MGTVEQGTAGWGIALVCLHLLHLPGTFRTTVTTGCDNG